MRDIPAIQICREALFFLGFFSRLITFLLKDRVRSRGNRRETYRERVCVGEWCAKGKVVG